MKNEGVLALPEVLTDNSTNALVKGSMEKSRNPRITPNQKEFQK